MRIEKQKTKKALLAKLNRRYQLLEQELAELNDVNKNLNDPLSEITNENNLLLKEVERYELLKNDLELKRKELMLVTNKVNDIKWEIELKFQDAEKRKLACELNKVSKE